MLDKQRKSGAPGPGARGDSLEPPSITRSGGAPSPSAGNGNKTGNNGLVGGFASAGSLASSGFNASALQAPQRKRTAAEERLGISKPGQRDAWLGQLAMQQQISSPHKVPRSVQSLDFLPGSQHFHASASHVQLATADNLLSMLSEGHTLQAALNNSQIYSSRLVGCWRKGLTKQQRLYLFFGCS